MNGHQFYKMLLPSDKNLFNDLFNSAEFESTGKGRIGNHLVDVNDQKIPIVRTTTRYNIPAVIFSDVHHRLVDCINEAILAQNMDIPAQNFNNALIEVYDSAYTKMNFHSDQSLDIDSDSYIALFSCYERQDELEEFHVRKLVVKDKITNEEFEIVLDPHSVVLFSFETNKKFQHKIILDSSPHLKTAIPDNKWLGITFRTSKTYIQFNNELPYFSTGELFKLADKEQESEFFQLRGQENKTLDFVYPNVQYTLSTGDIIMPVNKK